MTEKVGFVKKIKNYLEDVKKEFGKLSSPPYSELLGYTYVVIATTFFFTAFIYLTDMVLTFIVQNIY